MDTSELSPLAAPAPLPEALPSRNHSQPPSLGERVQSLRLRSGGSGKSIPRSALLPWGLTLICLLATLFAYYRFYRISRADPGSEVAAAEKSPGEGMMSSGAAPVGDVALESKGYVIAAHTIQISPQVGGEVIKLLDPFKEGLEVKKGTIIAVVDPESYDARVRSARQQVKVDEAKLKISKIDKENKIFARVGTSQDDKDKAVAQFEVDEAQVARSKADLDDALKQRRNCDIIAPITGIVLTKKAELHGYVNPFAFGASGYLCEMADLGDLEIEVDVQERDLPRVFTGQKCILMPDAYRRDEDFLKVHPQGYEGIVDRLMPTANRSKAAVPVRVAVKIPAGEAGTYLRPDMSVIVSFLGKK